MKLGGGPEATRMMSNLGVPEGLTVPLAVLELTCLLTYLCSPTAVLGAILRTGYNGGVILAHWHPKADETVFVVEGDLVEGGASYRPGSYFVSKARTTHGPHAMVRGCTVLTHLSAEIDFQTGPVPPEA